MTIKLFSKQIEVVDYESFIITINTIALVYLLILYLRIFLSLGSITQAIIQYIHYILFCCIYINNYTIIRI